MYIGVETLKIYPVSDLHLEWENCSLPGDPKGILVIAGDICETSHAFLLNNYLNVVSSKFKHVIIVLGNHEFYGLEVEETKSNFRGIIKNLDNVFLLDNETVSLDGITFIGSTLWSDFNGKCTETMKICQRLVNDFRFIGRKRHKFSPKIAIEIFEESVAYIKNKLVQYKDKKIVVITHHAPSFLSINPKFAEEEYLNGAFASNLEYLMEQNTQIYLWIHGHNHNSANYNIGSTQVICNPKGYRNENPEFNPNFFIEV